MSTTASAPPSQLTAPSTLYPYTPTQVAPAVFLALFFILGAINLLQSYRWKSWRFTFAIPWAAIIYVAACAMRIVSTYYTGDLGIYIALSVLIYTGPPVYQAANYFVLGRALHYIPQLSPIHPGRVVSTFVGLDVLVEILVGSGASRIVRWDKSDELAIGLGLIKAALLLQVVLFLGFIGLQALFHRRCIRHGVLSPNLRSIMILMYMSNTLILFRNVFRVIDNFLPNDAGSKRFETYEWCLDVLPIALNGLLLTAFFPAVYLPRSNKVYIGSDGRTERHGPGWQDKRPFLQTLFDPFDCIGLARGADTKNRFWEHEQDHPVVVSGKEEIDTPKERSMLARVFDPFGIGGFKASFSNPPLFKDLSPATA